MKIYFGSDHGGFNLKQLLVHYFGVKRGLDIEDVGGKKLDPDDDYPQFAQLVVSKLIDDKNDESRAILVCRGGQGMAMAANRYKGIRAAVCWDENSAKKSREDNNSNVLCLPADILSVDEAKDIIHVWLRTPFSRASRHQRRIKEIDNL